MLSVVPLLPLPFVTAAGRRDLRGGSYRRSREPDGHSAVRQTQDSAAGDKQDLFERRHPCCCVL